MRSLRDVVEWSKFVAEVLRRKVMDGARANELSIPHVRFDLYLILLSMSALPSQTRYVCSRCIQNVSRRHSSSVSTDRQQRLFHPPKTQDVRRNNGLTWEGRRFRKIKVEEEPSKYHASNILVGKDVRTVPVGPTPALRVLHDYQDIPEPERPRPVGRIRGGRARIPGPKAAEYLNRKETSSEDLVPSVPSPTLGSSKVDTNSNVAVRPTLSSPKKPALSPSTPDHFNWYWETMPPAYNETSRADDFFAKNRNPTKLLRSAARFMDVPDSDVPEVAFVGRSNVGKSSLLNAVVDANAKDLVARTSATRGFTRTMNFYGIGPGTGVTLEKDAQGRDKIVGNGGLVIVDMPGYGDGSLVSWGVEIMKYIQSRKQLRRVFVLLDTEHGIKDKDRSLLASLRLAGVSHQVILSKMDKVYIPKLNDKKGLILKPKGTVKALREKMESLRQEINPPVGGGALGEILACSSATLVNKKRLGIDHVRYAVLKAVGLERTPPKSLGKIKKNQLKAKMNDPLSKEDSKKTTEQSLLRRL